jgi:hypothetical protein
MLGMSDDLAISPVIQSPISQIKVSDVREFASPKKKGAEAPRVPDEKGAETPKVPDRKGRRDAQGSR